jgi:hypothetical protein
MRGHDGESFEPIDGDEQSPQDYDRREKDIRASRCPFVFTHLGGCPSMFRTLSRAMTKREIAKLLSPSLVFALIAATAFFMSGLIRQHIGDNGGQQKFDQFVANARSGKSQLTTDQWLEGMRRERATVEAYRKAAASDARLMQLLAWSALAALVMQTLAVLSVRKKLNRTG